MTPPRAVITYTCAHCHAHSDTGEQLLDRGMTFKCEHCGELTVVGLSKPRPKRIKPPTPRHKRKPRKPMRW